MERKDIKRQAREFLGGKLFGDRWLIPLLVMLVYSAVSSMAAAILPPIGILLVTGPLSYGLCYPFLKHCRDGQPMEIGDLFNGFTEDAAQNILLGVMINIFTLLWTLLFIIPGLVKNYSYAMAYYIKVDNKDYDWRQCIDLSRAIMDGNKWKLFVLDLSFIGWYLVGALALGLGIFWVLPYHFFARTVFYDAIWKHHCGIAPQSGDPTCL